MTELEAQKKRILEKALELFKRHGINYVTMDLIARELGLSKKTLYVHFSGKEELTQVCLQYHVDLTRENHFRSIESATNVIDGMIRMVTQLSKEIGEFNPLMFEELNRYFPKVSKLVRENHWTDDFNAIVKLLEDGKSQGLIRNDIDSDIAGKLFLLQMQHLNNYETFPINEYPRGTLFQHLIITFFRGMVTKEGMEILDEID